MPAGVRGRRSQEKLAEKARGDVARKKGRSPKLGKGRKNSFVLVTEKCCTALCYESAPTIEALL